MTSHPNVTGRWTGTWTAFNPAHGAAPPPEHAMKLDATIQKNGDRWDATFDADCGGSYSYTVTMEGRQSGEVVLFKGMTDLGADGGGVFDWIGRATDREFIGFYTSAAHTGVFSLARAT